MTTSRAQGEDDESDGDVRVADKTSRIVRVSDVIWNIATFCNSATLGAMMRTCQAFHEVIDDSVWRVLSRARFIENLPRQFASWKLYYRYASIGEGVESGELSTPFVTPLDPSVTQKGNVVSINVLGARYPVVRLARTGKAAAILLTRPEYCHVGVTTSTTIKAVTQMWGPEHHFYALSFMLPGATIEMSIVEGDGDAPYLVVERLGGVKDEVVLREAIPDNLIGKPLYLCVMLAANFASFAAIG